MAHQVERDAACEIALNVQVEPAAAAAAAAAAAEP